MWCHCWVPLQGAIAVCFGGVDVVPLLGAISCHCSVEGGEGNDQLWGSGRGAIAGCHCRVPIPVSYPSSYIQGHQIHPEHQENNNEFCHELLADVTLTTQKLVFAIWGLCWYNSFSQIAIAIGVLTSNRGESDEPLWRIGRGTRVPLQSAVDVVPLQGAIVVCYGGGRRGVTTNFGGVDVVPLLGAIAGCHCSVLWGSGRSAIARCHFMPL